MEPEYNIAAMVILAIETVTKRGSLALLIDDACHARADEVTRTHGERLPGEALALLAEHGRHLRDVDLFAVVAGPGSFTGLRVGMAVVQGFALAGARRVAAVPTLEAMAEGWRLGVQGLGTDVVVVSCLDGQRGDLFFAAWALHVTEPIERATRLIEPSVGTPRDVVRRVGALRHDRTVVMVGTGLARHAAALAPLDMPVQEVPTTLAESAARIARRRPELAAAPHALRPLYIRRPDAELARERAGLPPP